MGCAPEPFTVYPKGFPDEIVQKFCENARISGVLGNRAASGTEIIKELGEEHLRRKLPILSPLSILFFSSQPMTRALPLPRLYEICEAAREVCDEYKIGRVIARPFIGKPGSFERTYDRSDLQCSRVVRRCSSPRKTSPDSRNRKSPRPFRRPWCDAFHPHGRESRWDGGDGGALGEMPQGFIFTNLVDFDMLYGHRRDASGYARCLEEFDQDLGVVLGRLVPGDLLIITSDHGNDPTFTKSTDHTREYIPILVFDPAKPKGQRTRDAC